MTKLQQTNEIIQNSQLLNMQKIIFVFISSFLLFSCGQSSTSTDTSAKKKEVTPTNVKYMEGLPPIYENFEDLAPIFKQQNDTTYVINFWSTWCAPCVKELPHFEALNKKYTNQKVKVILVSLDFKKQLETKLKPFLAKNDLQSEVLVLIDPDANSWVDKVNPEWSGAIPATYVYKKDKADFFEKSYETFEDLESILQPFL